MYNISQKIPKNAKFYVLHAITLKPLNFNIQFFIFANQNLYNLG